MRFCIILGLLSISLINGKYLLVAVDDNQAAINHGIHPKPISHPNPDWCVPPGGRCKERQLKMSITYEFAFRSRKPARFCCPRSMCVQGRCIQRPRSSSGSAKKNPFHHKPLFAQSRSLSKPKVGGLKIDSEERSLEDKLVSGENSTESMEFGINEAESLENKTESMENEKMISLENETESEEKNMKVRLGNITESMEEDEMISMENSTDSMEEEKSLERKQKSATEDVNCHWKDLKGKCINTCFGGFLETGSLNGGLVCHCTGKQCEEDPCKDCEAKAKAKGQTQWACPC